MRGSRKPFLVGEWRVEPSLHVIQRDTEERGRSVQQVLERYELTVKPMHLQFIEPSKRVADVIVPQGGKNEVAISVLLNTIQHKLKL